VATVAAAIGCGFHHNQGREERSNRPDASGCAAASDAYNAVAGRTRSGHDVRIYPFSLHTSEWATTTLSDTAHDLHPTTAAPTAEAALQPERNHFFLRGGQALAKAQRGAAH